VSARSLDRTAVLIRIESPEKCFDPIWPKRRNDKQNPCRTANNDLRPKPEREVSNLKGRCRPFFFNASGLAQRHVREPLRLALRRPVEEPDKLADDGGFIGCWRYGGRDQSLGMDKERSVDAKGGI
jgi:hypothetical protein